MKKLFNKILECKKSAFTLAEVLIAIAIIGIVASIAIMKVYSGYQKIMFKS